MFFFYFEIIIYLYICILHITSFKLQVISWIEESNNHSMFIPSSYFIDFFVFVSIPVYVNSIPFCWFSIRRLYVCHVSCFVYMQWIYILFSLSSSFKNDRILVCARIFNFHDYLYYIVGVGFSHEFSYIIWMMEKWRTIDRYLIYKLQI